MTNRILSVLFAGLAVARCFWPVESEPWQFFAYMVLSGLAGIAAECEAIRKSIERKG